MPTMSFNAMIAVAFIGVALFLGILWLGWKIVSTQRTKFILILMAYIFAICAAWCGWQASYLRGRDLEQHDVVAHAVMLAEGRLEQTRGIFRQSRHQLDILAASDELHARIAVFTAHELITLADWKKFMMWELQDLPWITEQEAEAASMLIWGDQEQGWRPLHPIVFNEGVMTVTVFGTPLHARTNAWVLLQHGSVFYVEGERLISGEALGDDWYLTIISRELYDYATRPFWWMIGFIIAALIPMGIWIWGHKTARIL